MSTLVGAGASLVSEDTEVDNILATTREVDDDMAITDTAVADYELPSNTIGTSTTHIHAHTYQYYR